MVPHCNFDCISLIISHDGWRSFFTEEKTDSLSHLCKIPVSKWSCRVQSSVVYLQVVLPCLSHEGACGGGCDRQDGGGGPGWGRGAVAASLALLMRAQIQGFPSTCGREADCIVVTSIDPAPSLPGF